MTEISRADQAPSLPSTAPGASPLAERLLKKLMSDDASWMDRAECRDIMTIDFVKPKSIPDAQEICNGCVVRERCLEEGLRARNEYGIWGGEDVDILLRGEAE